MIPGLWLFCGFISWTAAASPHPDESNLPLFADQIEQLTLAGNGDNVRVKPSPRKQDLADGDDNPQSPEQSLAGAPTVADWRLSLPFPALPAPLCLLSRGRYWLPAQRAPPNA